MQRRLAQLRLRMRRRSFNAACSDRIQAHNARRRGVDLAFDPDAVEAIADLAVQVNESVENIGARRLHTVIERVLDEISFTASDKSGQSFRITGAYVREKVEAMAGNKDLSKYIL